MKTLILFFSVLAAMLFGSGCDQSGSPMSAPDHSIPAVSKTIALPPIGGAGGGTTGLVTVVHGVPNLVVDVYVNGKLTLPDFTPGSITRPLELPTGNYYIQVTPKGKDTSESVIRGTAFLPVGANVSLVAHLSGSGVPQLSAFVNNVEGLAEGKSRLVVRHTAYAPAVDVELFRGGRATKIVATLPGLTNPHELSADIRPGQYTVDLTPAGSTTVVFGPVPLLPHPGISYIVYATGSLGDHTFGLLVQTIPVK
jgi:hypothetical protein